MANQAAGGVGSLEVLSGPDAGRVVLLGQVTSIGRARDAGLALADTEVSRVHAEVRFDGGSYLVLDLGSRNGVRLDDAVVKQAPLRDGQKIRVGRTLIAFREQTVEVPLPARLAALAKSPLLGGLAAEDRNALAAELQLRFYPKDAVVRQQGQAFESMLFVHAGQLRVVSVNEAGGERVVATLAAGDAFGERALVSEAGASHGIVAETDAWLLELSKKRLSELLKQRPAAGQTFHGNLAASLRAAQDRVEAAAKAERAGQEREARREGLEQLVRSTDVEIVGSDPKIAQAKKKIEGWAREAGCLLITGPAGSGKKTFARYYHKQGPRAKQPYIELSLGEQTAGQASATIFGEEGESGAPGALGYLEMMGEGTLTLLHAELLDVQQQMMILSYLKRGFFQRAFGQTRVVSQARLVLVGSGPEDEVLAKLLPELRELLSARKLAIPPLTARLGDVPLLARHVLEREATRTGKHVTALSREATDRLVSYSWPGNVLELEHVLKRAAIVAAADAPIPVDFIFVVAPEKEVHRLNLLRHERLRRVLRHPALTTSLGLVTTGFVSLVFLFTAYGAFVGPTQAMGKPETNPGMWLTWHVWFAVLPLTALLAGRVWCTVCPIAFVGDLFAKVARLNLPVPKLVKRLDFWLLLAAFVVVDSTEGLTGVADSPLGTAVFLVLIMGAAVFFTFVFERRVFCRYFCPLSGWLGTYATVSAIEVRGNKKVCQTRCGDYSCYKGTARVPGCPMFVYPASMTTNAECMMCGNCIKSCENRGVQLNLRPPLQELWQNTKPSVALGLFPLVICGVMLLHQFGKLAWWKAMQLAFPLPVVIGELGAYALFVGFALTGFVVASVMSAAVAREKLAATLARFGLGFVPLALAGHLTFVTQKFLKKGIVVISGYFAGLYDSLVKGVPLGSPTTATLVVAPPVITFIKFQILLLGIVGSLIAIVKIARAGGAGESLGRALPQLLFLFVLAVLFLYAYLSVGS